ncbi:pyridoxal-dependent decarboxylase [Rhizobium acidisoli]|uniref:pyridoxal-dependent decarboxylase n=1 Tax=Rhizobium acidisoli TaxID=1538158 RepID=UPI001FE12417|nr:pyridoxal-dependent decarboxylase [Rhizobium acidisoli]
MGVFDQIEELAALASERNIWFHTDACVGGFLSPFAEQNGHQIPLWDFRVKGVKVDFCRFAQIWLCSKGGFDCRLFRCEYQQYQVF